MRGLKFISFFIHYHIISSHPLWVRGLKSRVGIGCFLAITVAPFMGAWIEIIVGLVFLVCPYLSHPLWVRGLKYLESFLSPPAKSVAPFMGAWIEILNRQLLCLHLRCRTLYGCVD